MEVAIRIRIKHCEKITNGPEHLTCLSYFKVLKCSTKKTMSSSIFMTTTIKVAQFGPCPIKQTKYVSKQFTKEEKYTWVTNM